MTADSRGRELFIVDNSVSGWTGLRYLQEWSGIAKAFDIAIGYFEIGALLALDRKWQELDRSEKATRDDSWRHEKIILEPFNPDFEPLVFTSAGEDEPQVIAELVEVMEG